MLSFAKRVRCLLLVKNRAKALKDDVLKGLGVVGCLCKASVLVRVQEAVLNSNLLLKEKANLFAKKLSFLLLFNTAQLI